jgi:hypothetical protein
MTTYVRVPAHTDWKKRTDKGRPQKERNDDRNFRRQTPATLFFYFRRLFVCVGAHVPLRASLCTICTMDMSPSSSFSLLVCFGASFDDAGGGGPFFLFLGRTLSVC